MMLFKDPIEQPGLLSDLEGLRSQVTGMGVQLRQYQERIAFYEEESLRLHEIIRGLQKRAFGPKKERWESQEQGCLVFNEAETLAAAGQPVEAEAALDADGVAGAEDEEVEVSGFKRKRGKRKSLPEHLPREVVIVELPESERKSAEGEPLKVIGKEVTEKLFYEPAKLKVFEYHHLRYGLDSGEPVKTAPPVPQIIPKGIPTASLLSAVVVAKYGDGLPLYRQEEIFSRQGVHIPRCTIARWIIRCSEAGMPVWNVLEDRLLASPYVSCDETHTQVLKEKGRSAESKSWMWIRATPSEQQKIVLFDYDPHRSGDVAKRLLADFQGFLQCDGYVAYDALEKKPGIVRIGCNMHGRRRYYEAADHGAKPGQTLAAQGVKYYERLYKIEEKAKEMSLSWADRKLLRDQEARPIWEEMKIWAETNSPKVPPKSKLGGAFHYFLAEYRYLTAYLQDGMLEMDNGFAERSIRKFAIGRNGWLFSDSEDGAHASALLYSFVVTAKVNGLNPYDRITRLFDQLPYAKTLEDYEKLADLLVSPTISL